HRFRQSLDDAGDAGGDLPAIRGRCPGRRGDTPGGKAMTGYRSPMIFALTALVAGLGPPAIAATLTPHVVLATPTSGAALRIGGLTTDGQIPVAVTAPAGGADVTTYGANGKPILNHTPAGTAIYE